MKSKLLSNLLILFAATLAGIFGVIFTNIISKVGIPDGSSWVFFIPAIVSSALGVVAFAFHFRSAALDEKIATAEGDLRDSLRPVNPESTESKWSLTGSAVQPAWEIARGTLEKYWTRNLTQNLLIFILSVLAITAGFAVMLWGVAAAINDPKGATVSGAIGAGAGILTQFIGATFLLMYRSTLEQAAEFNRTIERINSVGMAWFILQTMPEEDAAQTTAKNDARLALIIRVCTPNIHPKVS